MYPHIEYPMIHAVAPELCGSFDSSLTHSQMHIEWLSVLAAKFDIQNPDAAVRCRPNNNSNDDEDEDMKTSLAKGEDGPNTEMVQKSQVDFECKCCKSSLFRQCAAVLATLAVSATEQLLQLWLYCGKYLLAVTLAGYYFSSALVVALALPNWICNVLFLFFKTNCKYAAHRCINM